MYVEGKIGQINQRIEAQKGKFKTMLATAVEEKTRDGKVEFDIRKAKEVLDGVDQLFEEILEPGRKLQSAVQSLTQAEENRKAARQQYDKELDSGNRKEADDCLDKVKEARREIARCEEEVESLRPSVLPLYTKLKKLRTIAGELKSEVEKNRAIIDVWNKRADLVIGCTVTTLSFISEINDLLSSFSQKEL